MATGKKNNANSVTSGTISGNLGFTIQWVKSGNVVYLLITNDNTKIPYGESVITTMPSNLTPKKTVYAPEISSYYNHCSFVLAASTSQLTVRCGTETGPTSPNYVGTSMTYIV